MTFAILEQSAPKIINAVNLKLISVSGIFLRSRIVITKRSIRIDWRITVADVVLD